ncbi:MAG TPA: hypothetical protein VM451_01285 [Candidatus Limnocylindria bacterium]|nr:hypothetical protein [Candidatus Limnocylindria bacterium]
MPTVTASRSTPSKPPAPTAPAFITTTIEFENAAYGVYGLVGSGSRLWVEADDAGVPRLYRVDAGTGKVLDDLEGSGPEQIGGDLWYAAANGKDLVRADIVTGKELGRVTPPHLGAWTKVDEMFWIATESGNKLTRWDSSSGEVVSEIPLPVGEPKDVVAAGAAIWIAIDGSDVLVRVDPETDTIATEIEVGTRPHTLAAGFGSVWVVNHGERSLARVDLQTNAVTKIDGVGMNVGIALLDDELLVVTTPTGIATIDTDANRVERALEWARRDYYALAIANGIWMSDVDKRAVYRIDAGPGTPGHVDP